MTSISRDEIYEIFSLDKDEKILDEFNCFFVETFPIIGKLYLSENHILFYSNIFFIEKIISIPINDIIQFNLIKTNIEIETKSKENLINKHTFFSNNETKNIYEKIKPSIQNLSFYSENDSQDIQSRKTSDSSQSQSSSNSSSRDNLLIDGNEEINEEIIFSEIEPDVDFEVCKKIINITPKDLFNKYFTNKYPDTSYEKYYEWVGDHSNIKISEWEKIEENENSEKFKKTEEFSLSLHGVPFVDHSEVFKTSIYYIEKDGTYIISSSSKNKGIPYADSFTIEAKIELHPYSNGNKTVFRAYVRTNFLESFFLQKIIISQTKKSYSDEINKWLEFIQDKGEIIKGDYLYKENTINSPFDEKINNINHNEREKKSSNLNSENKEKIDNNYKIIEKNYRNLNNKSIIIIGFIGLIVFIIIPYFVYKNKGNKF